jgi:hypothetical protein
MECPHCKKANVVKNGKSRHGHQRWLCLHCHKTFGEVDHRCVAPELKESALRHYAEGVGLRCTERLVGVSHVSVMNWVLKEVEGKALAPLAADEVEFVEVDELWTYIGKKKNLSGCGGLLIVLPKRFAHGHWVIVEPKRPSVWMRNFLAARTSPSVATSGIPTESFSKKTNISKEKRTHLP